MARRRPFAAYGTAAMPPPNAPRFPLPPPPDGKAPTRLPVGMGEQAPPMPQQPAMPPTPPQDDPSEQLIRLLQQLGAV